jgi:hypothetical protein
MALEDWIDLKRIQPQIGQCDDGAYDAAACQNLECLRDEVANIYDILTLTGNNGDPTYTDTGSGENLGEAVVVMDEIPAGQHQACTNTVRVTARVCWPNTSDNAGASGENRFYNYTISVYCTEPGGAPVLLDSATFANSFNTPESAPAACESRTFSWAGLSCTGQISVEVTAVSQSGVSFDEFTAVAEAYCTAE